MKEKVRVQPRGEISTRDFLKKERGRNYGENT